MNSKSLFLTLLLLLIGRSIHAQLVTNYTFAATAGTFSALSGANALTLTAGNTDDGNFDGVPIGFDFWYLGTRYTTISASTNGWITLGATITNSVYTNSLTNSGSPRPVIAPLWDDLEIQAATNVTYLTSGSAGSRVFTLQYLNSKWDYLAAAAGISYQVKLYESTGKIEFVYRPESGALNSASASIGITAAATGAGNFRSLSNAGNNPNVSSTSETSNINAKPSSGRTYSFSPAIPTAPSSLVFSSVGANSMTMSWTDNSSNELGFVIYQSTNGTTYTFLEQKPANATSTVASGLTPSTTYYWRVYAVTEGGLSTALSGSQATICNAPNISLIPTANLIGNYKFAGNASDAAGNNQGTLQGSPTTTTDRFSIANRAYSFNGSTQYVSTANSYVNPQEFTISIWFKTSTTTGGKLMGFETGQTGTSSNYDRLIYMNNAGQVYFGVYASLNKTVNTPLSYNDNNWHQVTGTLSSTNGMILYMDGVQVAADPTATSAENITGYWRMGFGNLNGWPSQPSNFYFTGALDDALIYHRALSSTEVNSIFTNPDGAGNNGPVCSGSTLNLTAATVGGATYAWSGPNSFSSSSQNPSLTYATPYAGVYTLTATLSGCSTTAYTIVTSTATQGQWTGNTSTDWATASNWCTGAVPTSATDVTIAAGATNMPSISSSVACKSLTINAGATVTTTGTGTLNIAGTLTNNGTMTNNGTTVFNGTTGQQTFTGVTAFHNLTIANASGLLLPANITVTNDLTITAGTLNANNFNMTVGGNWTNNSSTSAYTAGTGTVTMDGSSSKTIGGSFATTFNKLTISKTSSTVSLAVNAAITGDLTVTSGTLDLVTFTANRSTAGGTLFVNNAATLKIGGTNSFPTNYTQVTLLTGSTVEYSGTNQAVSTQTYGNLTLSSSSGAAVKTMPGAAFTVAGNLTSTVGAGTSVSYTAAEDIDVNGNVSIGASTTFNGGSAAYTHRIGNNWVNNGTFTGNASSVEMLGTGSSISGTGTHNFNNLTISGAQVTVSGSSNLTVAGNLQTAVVGDLTHNAGGTLTMSGSSKTIAGAGIVFENLTVTGSITTSANFKIAGNLTVSGSLSATAGTINLCGSGKTISGAGTIGFSSFLATGSITCTSDFAVAAALSVSGSLTATAGTATFTNSSSLSGTANLHNVTLNCTTMQMNSNAELGIANALTMTAGTLDVSSNHPNAVNFNGTGAQTVNAITYDDLILSGGNTKTAAGAFVAHDLTIGTGTTLAASSYTHTVNRDWTNNGTFSAGTSTIRLAGPEDGTITGATTFYILTEDKTVSTADIILASNVSVPTLNMDNGSIHTYANTITITNTRTGNGEIMGNIQRTHSFTTGVAYAFESAKNTLTFSALSSVTSITVSVTEGAISDFPFGGSISRLYNVTVPAGTYTATWRLHYKDTELNGNNESSMDLWRYNGATWASVGKTANHVTDNYVELSGVTDVTNRWTLSDDHNVACWNGSVSTNWNTAANWTVVQGSASAPPSASDIVNLGMVTFTNQPTISNAVTVKNIEFGSAQAVTLTIGSGGSLTSGDIKGSWSANATHAIQAGNQNLTVNGQMELSDGTNGHAINLSIGTGSVTVAGVLTQAGGANITFTGAGTLHLGSHFHYMSGTFTPSTSTVVYEGSALHHVGIVPYNNLTINMSGGNNVINDTLQVGNDLNIAMGDLDNNSVLTVLGDVIIATGATFDNFGKIYVGGDWVNNGTFADYGGTTTFNGTGAQSIAPSAFGNLDINKPSGTATITGDLTMSGDFTISAGSFDFQEYFINRVLLGGSASIANGATALISGTNGPVNFSNYALGLTSTIIFDGTATQYVNFGGLVFGNVIFRNGGANGKVLVSDVNAAGDMTIESGTTLNAGSYLITLAGNWTNSGTFDGGTGTTIFTGASKTLTGVTTFNKGTVMGSYYANDDVRFNDQLEIATTGSLSAGSGNTLTLDGDLRNMGYMYTTGNVILSGTQAQTLSLINATTYALHVSFNGTVPPSLNSTSAPAFGYLTINNTGGVSPSVGWLVGNNMTVASGAAFHGGPSTHNFYGSVTNNGTITSNGTFNFAPAAAATVNLGSNFSSTGLVNFAGAGAMTLAGSPTSMHDVLVSNTHASGVTPSSNWTIGNDLTIGSGSTLLASNRTHTIGGDIVNGGTFQPNTSTIILNGSTTQELSSSPIATGISFHHLTLNKPAATADLNTNVSVDGTLTFVDGNIATGSNQVTISATGTVTGAAQGTGWVNGKLQKYVATGVTTKVFEVGDATNYTPIDLAFASVSTAGDLLVSTTTSDHPFISNTDINATKSLNRYWTLINTGIAFTQYDATLHYVAGDADGGTTPADFEAAVYDGSTWIYPTIAAASATQLQATAVTNLGDFAVGQICNKGTTIEYADTSYCGNAGTATVTQTGTTGGTFGSNNAGLSINSATGDVDLGASTPGSYSVVYTIAAAAGCPVFHTTADITVTEAPYATLDYPSSPYCINGQTADPNLLGNLSGTFASTAGLSLNASTGDIDLAASTPGTYTVTYSIAATGGCLAWDTTATVVVDAIPNIVPYYNLISQYKFGETALDAKGNNDGTLQNNPVLASDRFAVADRAYTFNGSSQYVSTATSYTDPAEFTISVWFKTTTTSGGALVGFGSSQTGSSVNADRHIYMNNAGQVYFGLFPSVVKTIHSTAAYNDGQWHIATATLSPSNGMTLYMDGSQVAADNTTTSGLNYTGYWKIGYGDLGGWTSQPASNYFSGVLDDITIYDRALTVAEVGTLYTTLEGADNNGPICTGATLNLTASTISGATYLWTGPNSFSSSSQNPSLTFGPANAGVYAMQIFSGGCRATSFTNVTGTSIPGMWTGAVSTDWANAANWCDGNLPTAATDVTIPLDATNMPTISTSVACKNLTVQAGATLTTAPAGTLNVAGDIANSGTMTNNGTTNFNGTTGAQSFTGLSAFHHLSLDNSAGLALPLNITVTGDLSIVAGTLTTNNFDITLSGNWSNAGTFVPGSSTVLLTSGNAQTISQTGSGDFYKLTLNKSGNFAALATAVTVTHTLDLVAGIMDLNTHTLTISRDDSAAVVFAAGYLLSEQTDNSSRVAWAIGTDTTTHIVPFGAISGNSIPVRVKRTSGDMGTVTVSTYPTSTANTPYPSTPTLVTNLFDNTGQDNSANAVDRFWELHASGTAGVATVTFTAQITEIGSFSNLLGQRYDSISDTWDSPLPNQARSGNAVTVYNLSTWGPWVLVSEDTPFPVEFFSFDAYPLNDAVEVRWTTASETNSDFFAVQRSQNGNTFETAAIVQAAGNSQALIHYHTTDRYPYPGRSFYRVVEYDINGSSTATDLVEVNFDRQPLVVVTAYPNPTTQDQLHISILDGAGKKVHFTLSNLIGIVVAEESAAIDSNTFTHTLHPQTLLTAGTYLLTATVGHDSYSLRVMIQK